MKKVLEEMGAQQNVGRAPMAGVERIAQRMLDSGVDDSDTE